MRQIWANTCTADLACCRTSLGPLFAFEANSGSKTLRYSREELFSYGIWTTEIPGKTRRGTTETEALPSLHFYHLPLLPNVQSFRNKLDKLHANFLCQLEYKDAGLICIMETWLDSTITDSEIFLLLWTL